MKQAGKGGYTDQEIYRLKKIVQKLKQEMLHDEDSEAIFFFGLEKKNGQSRFIHALRSDKGQLLTEAGEIRRRAVQFYAQLYHSEYTEDEGAFNSSCSGLPRVSEETNKELEGPLTSEEVFAVLQSMKGEEGPRD
ncbi:hypothetical protein L3Q82_008135 [Scortum barcoo]|uniref:Uncharacterized protein n=1 Tax=Scortum barcoo TaxID=214431 RepID=A0ACB8WI43_9TELE|nr:hypothetical protein L3Q82_008135 [Scortum barcoo]